MIAGRLKSDNADNNAALGMNSGVQDADNLVWKLAMALKSSSKRYDSLLDTYDTERSEVGKRVGQTSLHNMRSHAGEIDVAMGVSASQTKAENLAAGASFFDKGHPEYAEKQRRIKLASEALDTEFKAPGHEVGWFYPSADINSEGGANHGGQQLEDGTLVHHTYFSSTIPGHHLSHAWVEREGETVALRDLLDLDVLTLFVAHMPEEPIDDDRVQTVVIGPDGWQDINEQWEKYRGVDEFGGVLVRPDGIVYWRGPLAQPRVEGWTQLVDRILKVASSKKRRRSSESPAPTRVSARR